jgi:hypothetical protein
VVGGIGMGPGDSRAVAGWRDRWDPGRVGGRQEDKPGRGTAGAAVDVGAAGAGAGGAVGAGAGAGAAGSRRLAGTRAGS